MKTSYFAKQGKLGQDLKPVSIALSKPDFYQGREYRKLAPPAWLLNQYHTNHNEADYVRIYKEEVLDKLDPQEIFDELGEDAVLLCWEKTNIFCHRRIVAMWFKKHLGLEVPEHE